MSSLRSERVTVGPTSGPLDVRGTDFDAALLVHGRLVVLHWCDCQGSIGQNLARTTSPRLGDATRRFRHSVETPVDAAVSLASHFGEVVSLLASGDYLLTLEDVPADSCVVEFSGHARLPIETTGFYPGGGAMVATQPRSAASADQIDHYIELIGAGARPTVVVLAAEDAWSEFIIDGHHKLAAYQASGIPIRRLVVTRLTCPALPLPVALEFLSELDDLRRHLEKNRPRVSGET